MTTVTNSKPRRQLSDQLDRLDGILDSLSEGLNGAVADAAEKGVRLAIKDAIIELMTDPTLRARLHEATAPDAATEQKQPPTKPGFLTRLKAKAGQARAAAGCAASHLVDGAVRSVRVAAATAAEGARVIQSLGSLKKLAIVGVAGGIALGVASYLAPHALAAAMSGVSGAVAAAAVQVGIWTRRAVRTLTLA